MTTVIMTKTITKDQLVAWIKANADAINTHVDQLNRMDAAIGDGDFGASIQRGVNAATALLPSLEDADIGTMFTKIGMKMMSKMGGTSGPLTGTLYTKMGSKSKGKFELTAVEFSAMFLAGVEGVMKLGKAQVGDKTMIDAYFPAAEKMLEVSANGGTIVETIEQGALAAKVGYESTAEITASKGRSSYLGERSLGAIDPGAYAGFMLLEALLNVVK